MTLADPWDEIRRLEEVLEDDLLAELEQARLKGSVASFCEEKCRVDDRCPLSHVIRTRDACPLWMYVRSKPSTR